MARIDAFLQLGREQGCSDIHFSVGLPPLVRLDGELTPLKYRSLSKDETTAIVMEILDQNQLAHLNQMGALDLSYAAAQIGRFRINIFRQHAGLSAVCRVVPEDVPALSSLGLPSVLSQFARLRSGLVLITGATGTGKSTTLAAIIDEINQNRNLNILTLEDPVEFRHINKKAQVIQREVGCQVRSFTEGLRSCLRQDPDVIMVGEMRDPETISLAVEASETGHLVLGTLHTRGAYQTIHRIVDAFPTEAQAQIRHTLAENLRAVVSQELVRAVDGRGRRAVAEILVVTSAVAQLIREAKTYQIAGTMATGRRVGMQTMDQALMTLVRSGDIDPDEAFLKAVDKKEFVNLVTQPELLNMAGYTPTKSAA
jgi:twitching motility protein PilT